MILDITEEEREFLQLVCYRAKRLAFLNVQQNYDIEKIEILEKKLRELDANLIKKHFDEDKC
jgi:hypothetical protein